MKPQFSSFWAIQLTVIFQLIVSCFAIRTLAQMLSDLAKKKFIFPLSIFVFTCCCWFSNFEIAFNPGSLSISCFIFAIWYFQKFLDTYAKKNLLFCGFFIGWMLFLRPFLGVYFVCFSFGLLIFLFQKKKTFIHILQSGFVLILPFMMMETIWVFRNYTALNKIILLQNTYGPNDKSNEYGNHRHDKYSLQQLRNLIFCWGGDNLWYTPNSEMTWFINAHPSQDAFNFPAYAYCNGYNKDSLILLKKDIILSLTQSLKISQQDSIENKIIERVNAYTLSFKKEKPLRYYLISPFYRLKNLVARNVVSDWPGESFEKSPVAFKILKLLSLGNYLFFVSIGLIFFLCFPLLKNKTPIAILVWFCLGAVLLTFAYFINFAHHSYFFTGFICCCFLTAFGIGLLSSKYNKQ